MAATNDIARRIWPLSWFDRWRRVPAYGTSLGVVLNTSERYAETLGDEVAAATGRNPSRGRGLIALGHVLGWGGLALSLLGLWSAKRPDIETLLFGPFGVGLLMQIPSGALVRAGRRHVRPTAEERDAVDTRRPVLLLRPNGSNDALATVLAPALERYGPLVDTGRPDAVKPVFGEADTQAALARSMDQAVLLVLIPDASGLPGWQLDAIAKRRHGHKTLVLAPANGWPQHRSALASVPGFAALPENAPSRLVGVHLAGEEPVLIAGSATPDAREYARAVDVAIYGMKCHGKW